MSIKCVENKQVKNTILFLHWTVLSISIFLTMSSLERLRSLYRSEKSLDIKFIPWLPSDIETSNEFAWVDSSVPSFLSINSRNCRRLISLDSVRAMRLFFNILWFFFILC